MRGVLRPLKERISGLPLRLQIGALVLLGLVAIFTLFGALGAAIANDAKQRTVSEWFTVAVSAAGAIDSEFETEYQSLERSATLVAESGGDPVRRRDVLTDTRGDPGSLASGSLLLDRDGAIEWSSSIDPALAGQLREWATGLQPLTARARYASGVRNAGGRPAVFLAVPVLDEARRPSDVLAVAVFPDTGPVHDLVASARGLAHSGHAELVDADDRVVVSSESEHALESGEHPDFYEPLMAEHRSGVGLTAPVVIDPADAGQRHDMAFVPLRTVPWSLALGGSDVELSAAANRWQSQILLFGSLVIALALLLVWLTTRSVARPILALAAASRQIAAGDLATPIPHEGDGEVRVLAQAFDHMRLELRAALAALSFEKSRYEGIVASMADAVVTTDTDLRITAFNPSAAVLTGWSAGDALGRPCSEVIGSCATREPGFDKTMLRRLDGREISVAVTHSPIRDGSGRVAGVVHVLRDISAEAEVDRLKEEFLSTVSHELRTPLGFIMGYATSLLLPDAIDDKATTRRCVEVIADASNELKELVDNLLDMTKIGAGSLSVLPEPTSLAPLVRAAVERIRVRGPDHRFETSVSSQLPPVTADAHRIEQVLYNLLDNAIKYSPDAGRITVRGRANGAEVMVSVIDEGLGIEPQELASVFERFHRGRIARVRRIAGTGLGLAICRGIIEAHGGRIWAESPVTEGRVHRGTAIHFTIPLTEPAWGAA